MMTEYTVKTGFWLRAYDSFTVEAATDEDAIEKAKAAARTAIERSGQPEHIDFEDRREGVIALIDKTAPGERRAVAENVAFDDDRIHAG